MLDNFSNEGVVAVAGSTYAMKSLYSNVNRSFGLQVPFAFLGSIGVSVLGLMSLADSGSSGSFPIRSLASTSICCSSAVIVVMTVVSMVMHSQSLQLPFASC